MTATDGVSQEFGTFDEQTLLLFVQGEHPVVPGVWPIESGFPQGAHIEVWVFEGTITDK